MEGASRSSPRPRGSWRIRSTIGVEEMSCPFVPKARSRKLALLAVPCLTLMTLFFGLLHAEQPPPPCHPNPHAKQDMNKVAKRGDVRHLPLPLIHRLIRMAGRPHSQLPTQAYAEASQPSQLFQYYLLDTNGFEPN